jgi:hypothetical protein
LRPARPPRRAADGAAPARPQTARRHVLAAASPLLQPPHLRAALPRTPPGLPGAARESGTAGMGPELPLVRCRAATGLSCRPDCAGVTGDRWGLRNTPVFYPVGNPSRSIAVTYCVSRPVHGAHHAIRAGQMYMNSLCDTAAAAPLRSSSISASRSLRASYAWSSVGSLFGVCSGGGQRRAQFSCGDERGWLCFEGRGSSVGAPTKRPKESPPPRSPQKHTRGDKWRTSCAATALPRLDAFFGGRGPRLSSSAWRHSAAVAAGSRASAWRKTSRAHNRP